jgi:predicted metal-dependent hydrolase
MQLHKVKKPRSVATKQAMVTRRLYRNECELIEKIWHMRRPRGLRSLQHKLDLLWKHHGGKSNRKPQLRFGPGTPYHGRCLSYTMDTRPGQVIELAPGERNFYVLAHELAHALGPSQHGIRFAKIYRDLLCHHTFWDLMATPQGELFLHYLEREHAYHVRKAYKD